jgi:hypothetical protein
VSFVRRTQGDGSFVLFVRTSLHMAKHRGKILLTQDNTKEPSDCVIFTQLIPLFSYQIHYFIYTCASNIFFSAIIRGNFIAGLILLKIRADRFLICLIISLVPNILMTLFIL